MSRFATTVAVAAALGAAAALAQPGADWSTSPAIGLGPLLLPSQAPVNLLQLTPTPMPPVTVGRGCLALGALESWNNYFDVDPGGQYVIDAERFSLTLSAAYGITDRLDVAASLPVAYCGGGYLDGFIEWFEGRLSVPNEDRRRFPRDQFLVLIHGEDGKTYQLTGHASGWGLEDGTVSVRYQIARGSDTTPAVLGGLAFKVPTGREDALHSPGGFDVEGGVSVGQRIGRFHLYGAANVMRHARSEFLGVRLNTTQWSAMATGECRVSNRTSWLLQGLVTSASASDFGGLARPTYEVTLGLKHVLGPGILLEASVLENLFVFDNSPDVGFHIGLVWRSPARPN